MNAIVDPFVPVMSDAFQLLSAALDPEGWIFIVGLQKNNGAIQRCFEPGEYQAACDEALHLSTQGYDAYYATSTFTTSHSRKAENVRWVKLLKLDIDVSADDARKYASRKEALAALGTFCEACGLPCPTVINSGYGLHIYWVLAEKLSPDAGKAFGEKLKAICLVHGLKIDPTVTGDTARILRVPGTSNFKQLEPRLVTLKNAVQMHDTTMLCSLLDTLYSSLSATVSLATLKLTRNVLPGFGVIQDHIVSAPDSMTQSLFQGSPKSMTVILRKSYEGTGCPQLKDICHFDTQKNQDYTRWRAGLSIAINCEDGHEAIHTISRHGTNYTPEETRKKAADLIDKPYLCSTFRANWPEQCKNCAHNIASPIQLGTTEEVGDAEPSDDTATVQRLAALPKMQYDRVRAKEAKAMGVRTSTLDELVNAAQDGSAEADDSPFTEVEPWPGPVDPADLLRQITELVQRFVVCEPHTARATALWVALSWFAEDVEVLPLANIVAPEKRCGKTTLLSLMSRLVRKPLAASNISPAALFRSIDKWGPTILLDEADAFMKDNEELRGLLNSGHTRDSAFVIRVVGDDFQPVRFNTWGPKVLCGIGKLADTLTDRSICLELRRRLPHETVERLRHADSAQFEKLAQQLARFAQDAGAHIRRARPMLPEELNDRQQDNWESLLAIADLAGGEWPELARAAALAISGDKEAALSIDTELLQDIQEVWAAHRKDRIFSAWLVQALCNDPDRRWATHNRGQPITPRQVAARLKNYGIAPQTIRIDAERAKGYLKEQFADVFARYLPEIDENAVTA